MKPVLPTCESCGTQWTWKQSFKALRGFYMHTQCPYCGESQFVTPYKPGLFLTFFLAGSPLIMFLFIDFTELGFLTTYAVILPILFISSPYIYRLKSKEPRPPIEN
ncbi:TIGR04104 family putative zinc finger protein [Alkalicoccus daliensis]|uniref:Cxxc_20_cxxc protein n=1 Tax=Alkalicoccus daliensis TaxID=745820 RepID=A0A1H0CY07_9BACI|nr:cxxc_20_cxxc protein [Alkalicoccus daliensis]